MKTITIGELIEENTKLRDDNDSLKALFKALYNGLSQAVKDEHKAQMRQIVTLVGDENER